MKKTIKDIIEYVSIEELNRSLKYFYPKDKNSYNDVYKKIKSMERCAGFNGEVTLKLRRDFSEDCCLDYEAFSIGLKENDIEYSSSFLPWTTFANTPIEQQALDSYTYSEILTHFIWDITFFGDEQDMKHISDEVKQAVDNIKKT